MEATNMKKLIIILVLIIFAVSIFFLYIKRVEIIDLPSNLSSTDSIIKKTLIPTSSYSKEKAPKNSLTGLLSVDSSMVFWQGRTATESAKVIGIRQIQQGETIETDKSGKGTLSFSQILSADIKGDTKLEIVQLLPASLVFLQTRGIINYISTGIYPISIRSYHLLISGADDFSVNVDSNKRIIVLKVNKGKAVVAYNSLAYISKTLEVGSGKTLIFKDASRKVVLK
jgi:hypothetical protein